MDSWACETIEGELSCWDGWACQLLTSEIQIKALLNWYPITVSGNVAEPCLYYGYAVRPILVFAQFAGDTSEMLVDDLLSLVSSRNSRYATLVSSDQLLPRYFRKLPSTSTIFSDSHCFCGAMAAVKIARLQDLGGAMSKRLQSLMLHLERTGGFSFTETTR